MAEFEYSRRFDVPEEVRKRAQQWLNVRGMPNRLPDVFKGMDIQLTDKQMESLFNSLDDEGKRYMGDSLERIRGMKEGGRLQRAAKERYQRDLLAQALHTEQYQSGYRPEWRRDILPEDMFGGGPKKGAVTQLDETLQGLRESNAEAALDEARKSDVADLGDVRRTKERAERVRNMDDVVDKDFLKETLKPDAEFDARVTEDAPKPKDGPPGAKSAARAKALRKGFRVIKGGLKALTPVAPYLGAAGFMMDAADAYALGESTVNPKTELDRARQKNLAQIMREEPY